MNYRTIVKPNSYDFEISHQSNLLLIGSCFSENIGEIMRDNKLNTLVNPFGILFNPISIIRTLNSILAEKVFTEDDLRFENGLYYSFSHHGKFSGVIKEDVLDGINVSREVASSFLKETDVLIITLGSAWAYRFIQTNSIVSNCHKVPNKEFSKELLSIENIVDEMGGLIKKLQSINPSLKIIFTISPVRHWKDGAEENTLSKSILNVAVHELVKKHESVHYFPAYEMVIDDLRDYRFYKEDMLHPNAVAVDYVWSEFEKSFFSSSTIELNKNIGKVVSAKSHKPFNVRSVDHQLFVKKQLAIIETLKAQNPKLNFDSDITFFQNQTN